MALPRLRVLVTVVSASVTLTVSSCSGCNKKGSKFGSRAATATEAPAAEPSASAEPTGISDDEQKGDIGEDVPPINDGDVAVVDTSKAAGLKHLVFNTTDATEAGRFMTEYLMIIRSEEDSCIWLKVRPTSGLSSELSDEQLVQKVTAKGPCTGQTIGPKPTEAPTAVVTPPPPPDAALRQRLAKLDFQPKLARHPLNARGFGLVDGDAPACSARIFRMPLVNPDRAGSLNSSDVREKTGRLLDLPNSIKHVRVWLDDEYQNICTGGLGLDQRNALGLGPLIQDGSVPSTWKDKLWLEQVTNLAAAMDTIVEKMQATYGPVSDVDDNGKIEIFMTPHVNRVYFPKFETSAVDNFRADILYRPEDLALYNADDNPLGNEGEILYMWVPSTDGRFNGEDARLFPSANSVSSNYAKGYLSSQVMNLIIANERLFVQKSKDLEERWIVDGLAGLASAYYAGNDWTFFSLAQYFTARPQTISLTDFDATKKQVSDEYASMAFDELSGMRYAFAWYLHSRLCGAAVEPCARLKEIITAKTTGAKTLEDILGEPLKKTLENFGLSYGVALLDTPRKAIDALAAQTIVAKSITLPDLTEVSPNAPPTTAETSNLGTADILTDDPTDRTKAGPIPSKDVLIFQPLSAENNLEIKLAKNSVTYVLVTGLVSSKTDVTSFMGKGLNVVFIPAGDLDTDLRRVHYEKVSELAPNDLRVDNLTSVVNPDGTNVEQRVYDTIDYSVTQDREVWMAGSINNLSINVAGAPKTVGDSDAYTIHVNPCDGLAGGDLTDCQAHRHRVVAQVYVRDTEAELKPMMLATTSERGIFRGHSIMARMKRLDIDWIDSPHSIATVCEGSGTWPDGAVTFTYGNDTVHMTGHGYVTNDLISFTATDADYLPLPLRMYKQYKVDVVDPNAFKLRDSLGVVIDLLDPGAVPAGVQLYTHTNPNDHCADGGLVMDANVFDHRITSAERTLLSPAVPSAFAHPYQNYLSLGPLGFPFTTVGSMAPAFEDYTCSGSACFLPFEAERQYLSFNMEKDLEVITYPYYAVGRGLAFPTAASPVAELTPEEIAKIVLWKNKIDEVSACSSLPPEVSADCTTWGLTSADCTDVCGSTSPGPAAALETAILAKLAVNNNVLPCATQPHLCGSSALALVSRGPYTEPWIKPDHFYWHASTGSGQALSTYYRPIEPYAMSGYCAGDPSDGSDVTPYARCPLWQPTSVVDIREQLNVPASKVRHSGHCGVVSDQFKACIDDVSTTQELEPDQGYAFRFLNYQLDTDRRRRDWPASQDDSPPAPSTWTRRDMSIATRAGEVLSKPERIQSMTLEVHGTGDDLNIVVGGRDLSEGAYLVRVRILPSGF